MTRTARLRLEPLGRGHVEDLLVLRSDERVSEWFLAAVDRAAAEESLATAASGWRDTGIGSWSAYLLEDGSFVGQGGPRWWELEGHRVVEVGWSLLPSFWGRGFATEIGRAGIDLAFAATRVGEVVAYTLPSNARSRAVMDRLGMGYVRDVSHAGHPHVLYSVSRERWTVPGLALSSGRRGAPR